MVASWFPSYQAQLLLVLTLVNFVNYIDRQIIFPLFSLIKVDFGLTDFELGLLGTGFSIVHALSTVPLGVLADRMARIRVITYGVLFWSGATFLSGIAASYRWLLLARGLVGVGEAAYTPAATALITGSFPPEVRARVQGVFSLGMFVGGAMGLALGGVLAEWVGWRPAFFLVGVPGLLLALTIMRLPEPSRAPRQELIPLGGFFRRPAFVLLMVSGWFVTFAGYSYVTWGTEFVYRYKGFGLGEAGVSLGSVVMVAGIFGVLTGAALADRLAERLAGGRVVVVAAGFFLSAPFLLAALHTPSKSVFLGAFFLATFFATWYHGPVTAILHDLIPAPAHGTAMGIYLFGGIWGPAVVGKLADHYGLLTAMHTALLAQLVGAFCFLGVYHLIRRQPVHLGGKA
jgi:predicted MFS family arabinose efflux permease